MDNTLVKFNPIPAQINHLNNSDFGWHDENILPQKWFKMIG